MAGVKNLDELVARRQALKSKIASGQGDTAALQGRLDSTKGKIQGMRGLFQPSKFQQANEQRTQDWADSNYRDPFAPPKGTDKSMENAISAQDAYNTGVMGRQDDYNRVNENNAFGSRSYSVGPDGRVIQNDSLSANQQAILGQQEGQDIGLGGLANQQLGGVANSYSQPFSLNGLGNDPSKMDFSADRRRIEDQIAGRFEELNGQRFQNDQNRLTQSLADRGIDPNSKQAQMMTQDLSRNQEDARRGAYLGAIGMAGDEMQRSYSMSQDARGRSIDEMLMQRDRPYQEMTNVLGSIRGPMLPNFQQRSDIGVPTMDIFGASSDSYARRKQNQWQGNQNAADRAVAGRTAGAGSLSYDQRLGLINAENQAAIARDNNAMGRPAKPTGAPGGQQTMQRSWQ